MRTSMTRKLPQAGFTLIEVMTAIVVFSIGLIGLGLLMTSAVRSNHVGYQHTQATFIVDALLDRMRANIPAIWNNTYNGTFSAATTAPSNLCGSGSPCTPDQVAARDTWAWGQMIGTMLPSGSGTVNCSGGALGSSLLATVPMYNGSCTVTLSWTEQSQSAAGTVTQQFQWVVKP
jgi:type IV pilus assembly protein PilV